jgi:hypothetical protein
MQKWGYVFVSFLLLSCSGLDNAEKEKLRRQNIKAEEICRSQDSTIFVLEDPILKEKNSYPWEEGSVGTLPKITKEFFRCKGAFHHLPKKGNKEGEVINDCEGAHKHSLPLIDGKENVYPVLLELLNYIQKKTQKKVYITSGHRCPIHNFYVDSSKEAMSSKHMLGAEVDFYVSGYEEKPHKIIELIMQFYKENPRYKNQKDYLTFNRYEKKVDVLTPPWCNKEIFIKLYKKTEGRNFDNNHAFPYISLQVRFDRTKKEKVVYDWQKAAHNYLRF